MRPALRRAGRCLFPACQPPPHRRRGAALMEYRVRHRTTYRYLQDVAQSWHVAHLLLRPTPAQTVQATHVTLTPEAGSRAVREDFFGNECEWYFFNAAHDHLEILAESLVTVAPAPARAAGESLS